MKFSGTLNNDARKRSLRFGCDLDQSLDPGIFKEFLSLHLEARLEKLGLGGDIGFPSPFADKLIGIIRISG